MTELKVLVKKLHPEAKLPTKAHEDDAGFDLYALVEGPSRKLIVPARSRRVIRTGIAMAIPEGWFGLVKDRSGLALKHGLHVLAGVVDAGYRGEVVVVLQNLSDEPFVIEHHMRIAQILILPVPKVEIIEVNELPASSRGEKGFGSTGLK